MLISSLDGKILHLKELDFIERMMADTVFNPDEFYTDLIKFFKDNTDLADKTYYSIAELERVDGFIKSWFSSRIDEARTWMVRAYVVGRFLSESDIAGQLFEIGNIANIPQNILDIAKQYGLTIEEAKAIQNVIEEGASLMTNTSQSTIMTVRNAVVEATKQGGGSKSVYNKLRESITKDTGELNRDLLRLSITATNEAFNNGYLGKLKPGSYVTGISMPDACGTCEELINGKVYKVRATPGADYRNLSGEARAKAEKIWENEVWVGKNNFGRSSSKRKRINPLVGNKEDNLREKEHSEYSLACLPMHPNCIINGYTPILTVNGWKPIYKIKIGELVLTHTGKFKKVIHVLPRRLYGGDVYRFSIAMKNKEERVTWKNKTYIDVTDEHPIYVQRNGERSFVSAWDVEKTDKIIVMGKKCIECGDYFMVNHKTEEREYCCNGCASKKKGRDIWKDPEITKVIKNKNSRSMLKQYASGIRDKQAITEAARKMMRKMVEDGTHPFMRPENRTKIAKSLGNKNRGGTKIEKRIGWILNDILKLNAVSQHPIDSLRTNKGGTRRYYLADWAIPDEKIIIECDGEYFHDLKKDEDMERQFDMELQGWTVLRFGAKQINSDLGSCKKTIERLMANHNNQYEFIPVPFEMTVKKQKYGNHRRVYNFTVEEDESYIVKGIVTHNCRCRWMHISENYQYIDKNSQVKLRVEDEDAWQEWYNENIL